MNLGNKFCTSARLTHRNLGKIYSFVLLLAFLQGCFSAEDFANAVKKDPTQQNNPEDLSMTQDPEKPSPIGEESVCSEAKAKSPSAIQVKFDWPAEASLISILRDGKEVFRTQQSSIKDFTDMGLLEGVKYTYSCLYYQNTGFYLGKEKALEETTIVRSPPTFSGITTLDTKSSVDSIEMQWGAATGVPVHHYQVFYKTGTSVDWSSAQKIESDPLAWKFELPTSDLQKNTEISFAVRACSKDTHSGQSFCETNTVVKSGTVTFNGAFIKEARVESMSSFAEPNLFTLNDEIKIRLTFDQRVQVSGTPQLKLNIGTKSVLLSPSAVNSDNLVFSYKVEQGDNTIDADELTPEGIEAVSPLILANSSITFDSNGVQKNANVGFTLNDIAKVDTLAPTIPRATGLTIPEAGYYKSGDFLSFKVNFSEAVNVTGTPKLKILIGGVERLATYAQISGLPKNQLAFRYQVQNGESSDGFEISSGNNKIFMASTDKIYDFVPYYFANDQIFDIPDEITRRRVQIDSAAPSISEIIIANVPPDKTFRSGDDIIFKVTLTEAGAGVNSASPPILKVQIGNSTRDAIYTETNTNGDQLTFKYRVLGTHNDLDGIAVTTMSNYTSISDRAGNNAVLPAFLGAGGGGKSFPDILIDNAAPKVTAVAFESQSIYTPIYKSGTFCELEPYNQPELKIFVKTDFPVELSPADTIAQIEISLDSGVKAATLSDIKACNEAADNCTGSVLTFKYEIALGDSAPNGISVSPQITLLGGGNLVRQTYGSVMSYAINDALISTPTPKIDALAPTDTFSISMNKTYINWGLSAPPPEGTKGSNQTLAFSQTGSTTDISGLKPYIFRIYEKGTSASGSWVEMPSPPSVSYTKSTYPSSLLPLETGKTYRIELKARDIHGNCSDSIFPDFFIDNAAPTVAITKITTSSGETYTSFDSTNFPSTTELYPTIRVEGTCEYATNGSSDNKITLSFVDTSTNSSLIDGDGVSYCSPSGTFSYDITKSPAQDILSARLTVSETDYAENTGTSQILTFKYNRPEKIWSTYGSYTICKKSVTCPGGPTQLALSEKIEKISLRLWGAGGAGSKTLGAKGGGGGYVYVKDLNVSNISSITVIVGEGGVYGTITRTSTASGAGGYDSSNTNKLMGGGGGDASFAYTDWNDTGLIAVAGGGGGGSEESGSAAPQTRMAGGAGGGNEGAQGNDTNSKHYALGGQQDHTLNGIDNNCSLLTNSPNDQAHGKSILDNSTNGGKGAVGGGGGYFGGGAAGMTTSRSCSGAGGSSYLPETTANFTFDIDASQNIQASGADPSSIPSYFVPDSTKQMNGYGGFAGNTDERRGGDGLVIVNW